MAWLPKGGLTPPTSLSPAVACPKSDFWDYPTPTELVSEEGTQKSEFRFKILQVILMHTKM